MQRGRCLDKTKNSRLEHAKIIVILVGACAPYSSLESYQKKLVEVGKMVTSKIEIKREKVDEKNYSGIGVVVYGVENEIGKIDENLLESFKDNKLGVRYVWCKLSTRKVIINAIRMNF